MANRLLSRIVNGQLDKVNLHLSRTSTFSQLLADQNELQNRIGRLEIENQSLRRELKVLAFRTADLFQPRDKPACCDTPSTYGPAIARAKDGLYIEPQHVESRADCYFYHTIDLPELGTVEGPWDLRATFDSYIGQVPLEGKRVLDVGTASGFLTFEAEKRGAEVVSFDLVDASSQQLLPFRDNLYSLNHQAWVVAQTRFYDMMKNSYWLSHRLTGSRARVHYGNIYKLPETLGQFDVVLIGSVVEHLSDQISALASVARLAADTMIINTPYLDTEEKIAGFLPSADKPQADYSWWYYSLGTYREVFTMLGFRIERIVWDWHRIAYQNSLNRRAAIVLKRIR
jgi:2-polyprenyl-3-methyl-5-hydroxy-6-metoxy-1,4-benzoquinol methylase